VRLASAELYDPTSETFTATAGMNHSRATHTATLMSDGKVLLAGGETWNGVSGGDAYGGRLSSTEVYDPVLGRFVLNVSMLTARADHTATLLDDGSVLIAGGVQTLSFAQPSAELFIPNPAP